MWRASMPAKADVAAFSAVRERWDLSPLVIHDNYLINLASSDPLIRSKSIAAYRGEVERALALDADFLVAHPGSSKGENVDVAIAAVADGLTEATRGLRSSRLRLLIENTAGQGSALGSRDDELIEIRKLAASRLDFDIAYCLDTAHCFAAGLDLVETAETLGLESVPVIHANDSKAPFGSRVDRHEHIGKGYIGEKAFRRILTHSELRNKAFILETPVEEDGDDARNISTLQRLCRKSRTTTNRSSRSG